MNSVSSNAVANALTAIDGIITATLENGVELKYMMCKRIISDYYFVNFSLNLTSAPADYAVGQIKISTAGFKLDGKNIAGVLAGKLYAKDANNVTFTTAATYDTLGEWVFFGPQHDLSMAMTTMDDFTSKFSGIVRIMDTSI